MAVVSLAEHQIDQNMSVSSIVFEMDTIFPSFKDWNDWDNLILAASIRKQVTNTVDATHCPIDALDTSQLDWNAIYQFVIKSPIPQLVKTYIFNGENRSNWITPESCAEQGGYLLHYHTTVTENPREFGEFTLEQVDYLITRFASKVSSIVNQKGVIADQDCVNSSELKQIEYEAKTIEREMGESSKSLDMKQIEDETKKAIAKEVEKSSELLAIKDIGAGNSSTSFDMMEMGQSSESFDVKKVKESSTSFDTKKGSKSPKSLDMEEKEESSKSLDVKECGELLKSVDCTQYMMEIGETSKLNMKEVLAEESTFKSFDIKEVRAEESSKTFDVKKMVQSLSTKRKAPKQYSLLEISNFEISLPDTDEDDDESASSADCQIGHHSNADFLKSDKSAAMDIAMAVDPLAEILPEDLQLQMESSMEYMCDTVESECKHSKEHDADLCHSVQEVWDTLGEYLVNFDKNYAHLQKHIGIKKPMTVAVIDEQVKSKTIKTAAQLEAKLGLMSFNLMMVMPKRVVYEGWLDPLVGASNVLSDLISLPKDLWTKSIIAQLMYLKCPTREDMIKDSTDLAVLSIESPAKKGTIQPNSSDSTTTVPIKSANIIQIIHNANAKCPPSKWNYKSRGRPAKRSKSSTPSRGKRSASPELDLSPSIKAIMKGRNVQGTGNKRSKRRRFQSQPFQYPT